MVDGKKTTFYNTFSMNAKSQRVEIAFAAIDFIDGQNTVFEYRLVGFEDQWRIADNQPHAEYTNLPAGQFRFELRVLNSDGTIKSEAEPIVFTKEEYWWKTTGAIIMYVLVLAGIIITVFQLRVHVLKRQREILQRKVTTRTAQLRELNETLEQKVEERTNEVVMVNEVLKASDERYRYALDASNDGIWDWDVKNDTIQFSPAIYTMLGYEPYEFEQSREAIYRCIHQEDQKKWHIEKHERLKLNASDDQLLDEYKMLSKQGEIVWIQVKGKVVERDGENKPERIVGTHTDITAEKLKTQEVLEAILRTEDMERSRISKDIHDGLQQTLTISSLNFQAVTKGLNNMGELMKEKFEVGWKYLQESIKESRVVAHSLMPKAIVDFGVISAFQNLIDDMNKVSEKTDFNFYHNFETEKIENEQIEITFYRILQEAINNINKYAEASRVDVQLKDYDDIYMLTIEDNGVGFDADKIKENESGLGFRSMRNRVEAIEGIIEIDSQIGRGTSILVEINKTT
jgi:PAS domain S-box-containing protein